MLREHAAAIEWPSVAWLSEKYPDRTRSDGADFYAAVWLGYTRSWETLLAAWDEGGCAADNDAMLVPSLLCARHAPAPSVGREGQTQLLRRQW